MKLRGREKNHGPQNVLRSAGAHHRCVPHADHILCKFSIFVLSSASSFEEQSRLHYSSLFAIRSHSRGLFCGSFARLIMGVISSVNDARNTEIFSLHKRKRNFHGYTRPVGLCPPIPLRRPRSNLMIMREPPPWFIPISLRAKCGHSFSCSVPTLSWLFPSHRHWYLCHKISPSSRVHSRFAWITIRIILIKLRPLKQTRFFRNVLFRWI